ncbi:hypothetical protein LOD99_2698 [Oopsacas minuta]|uniref:FAM124 domain-containing protein n=1 Tax=Oopsacas minuta TaxID=111878 RepID=A0AAV7K293_9METZ|nr:hypothetical protein LOD99_2698 [Oopsacas minuta]
MADNSDKQKLLDDEKSVCSPLIIVNQKSVQFDISDSSAEVLEILQNKDYTNPWKFPDAFSDSDPSDDEEQISADFLPIVVKRKQLSHSISLNAVQSRAHKEPELVLTDRRQLTQSNSYYGLLTCCRYLQQKDIRSKLDVIGVKKKIETGSYTAHTREYLHLLYEFKDQESYNIMCSNLMAEISKTLGKKTKKSDRIPISLQPARPIYSKLKCCLELSLTPESLYAVIDALNPLFVSVSQSVFHITAHTTNKDDVIPHDSPTPQSNRLPAFALCIQFNKVIFPNTLRSFDQRGWSALSAFPGNKSTFCYANISYGESIPYIICETGKESGIHGSSRLPTFAIYLFVSGDESAMLGMRNFYDILLLENKVKTFESNRIIYPLVSDAYSDRELILLHVPDKTTVQQKAISLYINTTNILSLICKLKSPVIECGQGCVSLNDPQGNRVVLRDLSHIPFFKNAVQKFEFTA